MFGPAFFLSGDSFLDKSHIQDALRTRLSDRLPRWVGQVEIMAQGGQTAFDNAIDRRLALLHAVMPEGGASDRAVLIGCSSGARVATLFARARRVAAVVCIGYPFRKPGSLLDPARFAHLADLATPTLIVQGVDDPYGGPELTETYRLSASVGLRFVAANHHFRMSEPVWDRVAEQITAFLDGVAQGRAPESDPFDEAFYRAAHPDVATAIATGIFVSGQQHFQEYGHGEARTYRRLHPPSRG